MKSYLPILFGKHTEKLVYKIVTQAMKTNYCNET